MEMVLAIVIGNGNRINCRNRNSDRFLSGVHHIPSHMYRHAFTRVF